VLDLSGKEDLSCSGVNNITCQQVHATLLGGFVFENYIFFGELTIFKNLSIFFKILQFKTEVTFFQQKW